MYRPTDTHIYFLIKANPLRERLSLSALFITLRKAHYFHLCNGYGGESEIDLGVAMLCAPTRHSKPLGDKLSAELSRTSTEDKNWFDDTPPTTVGRPAITAMPETHTHACTHIQCMHKYQDICMI